MADTETGQRSKVKKFEEQKDYLISDEAGNCAQCSFYLHSVSEPQSHETVTHRKKKKNNLLCVENLALILS